MTQQDVAARIEYTALKPATTPRDIERLCRDAAAHGFAGVCVAGNHVPAARAELDRLSEPLRLVAVAGFPLGNAASRAKAFEARRAIEDGADHVDMVLDLGRLTAGLAEPAGSSRRAALLAAVEADVRTVAEALRVRPGAELKVILETGLLGPDGIREASRLCRLAGAHWVKTSTGFGPRGASVEDVRLMTEAAEGRLKIKAAGGVRTLVEAHALIDAGADALGCSALLDGLAKAA